MPIQHSPVLTRRKPSALTAADDRASHLSQASRHVVMEKEAADRTPTKDETCVGLKGKKTENDGEKGVEEVSSGDEQGGAIPDDPQTGMEKDQAVNKSAQIGKLDESMYKIFGPGAGSVGSLSRSSSDTSQGSENAVCNGGRPRKSAESHSKLVRLGFRVTGATNGFTPHVRASPSPL